MNKIKNAIANWEWTTQEIANLFVEKYYGKRYEVEAWWVADEIGGVYFINDTFFNVDQMKDFLRFNYSKKKMFDYMDYQLDITSKGEIPWTIEVYKNVK